MSIGCLELVAAQAVLVVAVPLAVAYSSSFAGIALELCLPVVAAAADLLLRLQLRLDWSQIG